VKLETDSRKRENQANEILAVCQSDVGSRAGFYHKARQYYLHGTWTGSDCRHNKIKPMVNRASSFLYSARATRFWLNVPQDDEDEQAIEESEAAAEALEERWRDSGLDLLFAQAVKWALIYGCEIVHLAKQRMTNGAVSLVGHLVHPGTFGVWNPSEPDMLKQEAVAMTSLMSMPEVRRYIRHLSNSEQLEILDNLTQGGKGGEPGNRIMFESANSDGSFSGSAPAFANAQFSYEPQVGTPLYQLHDLYVWDDEGDDFRVFTLCGGLIVHDRPLRDMSVPGRVPFVKVCPYPLPDYFWGLSMVDDLEKLQAWFSLRVDQLDRMIGKILDPPKAAYGVGALMEEKLRALNIAGGIAGLPNAQIAKVEQFAPDVPDAVFEVLEQLGGFFIESAGMQPSMFGKQEPGTRTEGMLANAMRVSAAEIREVAMTVESRVEETGDMLWRHMRHYQHEPLVARIQDKNPMQPAAPRKFLAMDFPEDARVEVDGHSSSPLFVEDHATEVQAAFRMGAIDQQTALEALPFPLKSKALHRLSRVLAWKQIGEAIAKAQQAAKRGGKQQGQ
jgi:hypothetical protein